MRLNIPWRVDGSKFGQEVYSIVSVDFGDCRGNPANILIYGLDYVTCRKL